ncbi:ATPase H(+)-transporting accessory protein 2 [Neocloeon triangulifer]|uniref:ATPase H(+)-transporting accessory protein 2 n=1 Tax=Neocloeon triangulifer TaxID=2078957 RepID=UPI00286F3EF2|nr:ATPase H(+)-transporting accessory protein 2 [Neocloeon triangulifer]
MLLIISAIFAVLGSALGNGEFIVFSSPESVKFVDTSKPLPADLVPDVVAANLGFSTNSDSSWPGLLRVSPFNSARLAVIFSLDGPWARLPGEVAKNAMSKHKYQLSPVSGEGPSSWWMQLQHITGQRMMIKASAKQVTLADEPTDDVTDGIDIGALNPKVDEDKAWLVEMQALKTVMRNASQYCDVSNGPGILWLDSTALHALSDLHGPSSSPVLSATKILSSALAGLNEIFEKHCEGKVFIATVTTDSSHTRRTRSLLAESGSVKAEEDNEYNLSKEYDQYYPVMFNIFLFFGIGFFMSLVAISYAIANMDPGRDSIIYRMTSTRMKKDN